MKGQLQTFAVVFLFFISLSSTLPASDSRSSQPFAVANVHFEQNITDRDAEVVIEVKGSEEGLTKLTVVSPEGRTIVDFTATDASPLGMRQFCFESPEPKNIPSLKSAYPEGKYIFTGTTFSGVKLNSEAMLTHALPAKTSVLRPVDGAKNLNVKNLEIAWEPVENLSTYTLSIEQEELDVNLTAKLPGSTTTFIVPDGFLAPGKEYRLAIGTMAKEGNISVVETTFTTAGKE